MRRTLPKMLPALVQVLAIVCIAAALTTAIDPYVTFRRSITVQALDAALPVLFVLLVCGVGGRAWFAVGCEAVALGALRYADHVKTRHLHSNLLYGDFAVLPGFLKDPLLLMRFAGPMAKVVPVLMLAFAMGAIAIDVARRQRPAGWGIRASCLALAAIATTVLRCTELPGVIVPLNWEIFSQGYGASNVGITGNILLGRLTTHDVKRTPDPSAVASFWAEPLVREEARGIGNDGNDVQPDIVIVESESLFEPSEVCGFPDAPILKRLARERPFDGHLLVPVFGGRTLQRSSRC